MLPCLKPPPVSPPTNNYFSSPASQGYSGDNTPASSVQLSPTINLTQEYTLALQTNSYSEIRRTFQQDTSFDQNIEIGHADAISKEPHLLEQVLRPGRESVRDALSQITPSSLTHLVATYFEHSEHTSRLCLHLYQSIYHARLLYTPIHNILDDLPLDSHSASLSRCNSAFNIFIQFDRLPNPFLPPDSLDFDDIRRSFSQLRQQLDRHLRKSKSRAGQMRNCSSGSALCLIVATVGVAVSAVVIAGHAMVALVVGSLCGAVLPSSLTKNQVVHVAQLEAAAKGAYVLYNDLDTIDRLVSRLHGAVENDRLLVRLGLERGVGDGHSVMEVLKQIQRNRSGLVQQLEDLEEHIFLCFAAINRARSILLQEIHMHQNPV
ncbi:hypothetical protein OROMI_012341 [Orobanche minor]